MSLGTFTMSIKGQINNVPTPSSLSYAWNFGSLLGVVLLVQLSSGLILSFHYSPSIWEAFGSVVSLSEEVPAGWLLRSVHANGASFFFLLLYAHIGRGLLFKSYGKSKTTWLVGVSIMMALMGTAFLGYVLPWGQMSFWGATVITNLLSTLPWGEDIVVWVWGGYTVGGPTLSRFFSLHYIFPFGIALLSVIHILTLHEKGSGNPLGIPKDADKVFFHPLFTVKDLVGVVLLSFLFVSVVVQFPDLFMDPDNFTEANSLVTPPHIQPEWYFLFAYAILRSIPSKLGGVVALVSSVSVLLILPFFQSDYKVSVIGEVLFWSFVGVFIMLTWLGSMPVEGPVMAAGQVLAALYFTFLLLITSL